MHLCEEIIRHRSKSTTVIDEAYNQAFEKNLWKVLIMNLLKVLGYSLLLLSIPLIGMIVFPDEVQWTLFDFCIAYLLFALAGIGYSLIQNTFSGKRKVLYIGLIILFLIFVWLELAVGLLGTFIAGS